MQKRRLAYLVLVLLLCVPLSACTKEERIDRQEFSLRLERINKDFYINSYNITIDNKNQYVFFSLKKTDDCLMTLTTGKEGRLEALCLTLDKSVWPPEDINEAFLPFCRAVFYSFCLNAETAEAAISQIKPDSPETYKNCRAEYEAEGYKFYVFSNEICIIIEIRTKT